MTTALAKYDAACRAIAEAATVDEVKYFNDQATAMQPMLAKPGTESLRLSAPRSGCGPHADSARWFASRS